MHYCIALCDGRGRALLVPAAAPAAGRLCSDYQFGLPEFALFHIPYNYAPILRDVFGDAGLRLSVYGKTGEATTALFERAIAQLNDEPPTCSLIEQTHGNVRHCLGVLLDAARRLPHGVWQGD